MPRSLRTAKSTPNSISKEKRIKQPTQHHKWSQNAVSSSLEGLHTVWAKTYRGFSGQLDSSRTGESRNSSVKEFPGTLTDIQMFLGAIPPD